MASLEKRIEHLESLLSKQNIAMDYDDDETLTGMKGDQSSIVAVDGGRKNRQNIMSLSASIEPKHVINSSTVSNDVQQQQKHSKFVFSPWMNIMGKSNENVQQQYVSTSIDNKSLTSSLPQHVLPQATMDLIKEIPLFTIDLAERLIKAYFHYTHTRIPIIDKRLFLIQYYYQYPQPLERHLFFAVCAVGCQFLPRANLSTDKYSIERQVGKHLRSKAMDIMQFAYKESTISTLQTLLYVSLLASSSNNGEGVSTNWLILGASQDLELHREDRYQHLPKSELELRRRLAHSIYIWDKLSAAATGKPFTIRNEYFNVQVPSIYEEEPDDKSISINELSRNKESDIPTLLKQTEKDILEKRPIYTPHVQMIPMAQWICRILLSLYIPQDNGYNDNTDDISNVITNLDVGLVTWKETALSYFSKEYVYQQDRIYFDLYKGSHGTRITLMGTTSNHLLSLCTDLAEKIIDFFERAPVWGIPFMKDFIISMCATFFLQDCNNEDMTIAFHARRDLRRCANIYKNDDLVCQCQNAVVLYELSKQLPDEEESQRLQSSLQPINNEGCISLSAPLLDYDTNNSNYDDTLMDTIMTTALPESSLNDASYMEIILSWQELQQKQRESARKDLESALDSDLDQLTFK
ncbi:hypothetical protein INT45_002445 [Circinella minor]|uniref:Xylanolytic transcriptional activator regulatory domain-containing protein n=1 Tax=Circinella minor TaxID=1195481 RepID=A0A8H7SAW9_9FUNG|nr:hypothetical protein INT45_002445 [Circinella minor]